MGPWFNPEGGQVGPLCVYLSLKDQEATRGHGLHAPQEARPGNEAAIKMSYSAESPAGLASGRSSRGDCLHLETGGGDGWGEHVRFLGLP